jgi:hypothetical protein
MTGSVNANVEPWPRALGLSVPQALLAAADEVIE